MTLDMNTNNVYYLDMTGITDATTITLVNENKLPTEEILTDWGDGTQNSELTHTYSTAGKYVVVSNLQNVKASGNLKDYITKMVVYYASTPANMCFNYNKITEVTLTNNWAEKTIEKYGQKVSMTQMFRNCPLLELPNLELIKQFKPTYCVGMFYNCQKFTSIDLIGWDLSNCTGIELMFNGCTNLTEIKGIENWNISKVTSFDSMFQGCSSLTSLDLSSWDTPIVTNISAMFSSCSSLTDVKFNDSSFPKITNCANMFSSCTALTNIDLSSIHITENIMMNHMFFNCSKLQSIKMFNCDGNVKAIHYAFSNCKVLKTLDLSNLTIAPNTSVTGMLWGCNELEMIDLSNIRDIGNSDNIFTDCPKLTTLALLYSTSDTINTLAGKMPSTEQKTIYYQDADTSRLTPIEGVTFKKYQTTTLSLNEPIQLRSIGDVHDEINYETGEYIQRIGECIYEDDSTPTYNSQIGGYFDSMEVKGKIGLAVADGVGAISDKLINQSFTQHDFGIYGNLNGNLNIFDKTVKNEEEFINKYRGTKFQFILLEPIITKINTTILDQNNSYKSSQQTYDEQTYISVQSDTVVTPTSSVDYEIYSSTGTVTGTSATIDNAEAGTPVSGVVYGETLLNVIQEPSEDEYVVISDNFEGQSGTLENTVEGNIKSAILKGQTLVNHKKDNVVISPELFDCYDYTLSGCKSDTDYLIKFNAKNDEDIMVGFLIDNATWSTTEIKWVEPGNITVIVNSGSTPNYLRIRAKSCENLIIIEYQDGMENLDIPYFEGMQSVNLYPDQTVLMTTGKNLFDIDKAVKMDEKINETNYVSNNNGVLTVVSDKSIEFVISKEKFEVNTQYTLSFKVLGTAAFHSGWIKIYHTDGSQKALANSATPNVESFIKITSDANKTVDRISIFGNGLATPKFYDIQVEKGLQSSSYEPYKSNILTVNEEVHLHRVGDVQDELNLLTGELTQRVGEVVLDGSENWTYYEAYINEGYVGVVCTIPNLNNAYTSSLAFQSSFNSKTWKEHMKMYNEEYIWNHDTNKIGIKLSTSKAQSITEIINYLKENPIVINYQLAEPTIKTVSTTIVDQDDKPTDNLHTFDTTTHINTYAQGGGLIPFVSIPENISYDTLLKENTQYTVKLNRTNIIDGTPLTVNLGGTELSIEDGADSFTITTPSTLTNNTLSIGGTNNKVKEVMVIEGDCVDRDLDFFEGFVHVENPIVQIYNDNMWGKLILPPATIESFATNYQSYITTKKPVLFLKPNTRYIINADITTKEQIIVGLLEKTENGTDRHLGGFNITGTGRIASYFDTTNGEVYLNFFPGYNDEDIKMVFDLLEQTNFTICEHTKYGNNINTVIEKKSNTLTTYPQVTLRSIGDIKDEWDVVGETVTRRVGKITFDGTLDGDYTFTTDTNLGIVTIKLPRINDIIDTGANILGLLSDKYISASSKQPNNIICYTRRIMIIKPLSELELYNSTEKIKAFLQQNPFTVQYELATPVTESVRITPPNPQTSTASITIPTQLNHVEDTSDFLVWNPYKEHYVRYNYVEDGVVLDNYTWENLTDLDERQFVQFYNKRTYIDQPYHNYVASHDSKGTSKYVLIEPNQDYTVSVRFSELPTCETVKVNLGGAEVEMNVNDPHVHVTTPNTLVNNLCSISGDGLDGKVTDILVIHCLEHEGFADIDYFEGIDGIGEIVEVEGVPKSKIVMEQTNGNLIDEEFEVWNNGQSIRMGDSKRLVVHPNTKYVVKFRRDMDKEPAYIIYVQLFNKDNVQTRIVNGGAVQESNTREFTTNHDETMVRLYTSQLTNNGSTHRYCDMDLCYADMEKEYIRPRYNDKKEILLPIQLHRINTVYDNLYYDEMKGFYRIQQSIGHKYFVGADSENWTLIERGQRVLRFRYNNADIQMKSLGEYMTNLLPNGTATSPYESCTFNGTTFIVSIDKERLSSESLTAFKEWLTNNNLHLYYQLASPLMIDLPQYPNRIEFNTYKDEIYTFFKNCKPTVFTLGVPLDQTYRFYELEQGEGYANRVELTDERMTEEDTLYIDTIYGSGFSNLIENPNNVETLLKPNYQGKAVSHTLTNGKVSSIKVHGFEPNETTIANYNSTLKQYELIVQAQKGQSINTQTLAVPYKLEVYEDGTKDKVYYDEQNKVFRFEGGSVTNPPYNNSYIFNTPLEVFKGIAPRTGLIAEIKVKFNSGTTSARIHYSLDGGATTAYSTLRSMTDEVEYYIGFFNTGGTKLDYATKLSAEAEYIDLAPLSSTLPESLIITQIQNISECTFTLDKTYYFDSWIKPLELDVYNGETIITEQSGAIVIINNNGLHKDALTYTDETYTVYWTYVGGEGNVTITLGGTKVEVVGTQGYATLKTAIDGVQDGLIIGGYNLSIKDLMLVKGERIKDLAYFEGSRAVGTAFVDENGETKYKITLVTGSELINDKFENRITFEDNNKHNVVVTKLLGNKPNKK